MKLPGICFILFLQGVLTAHAENAVPGAATAPERKDAAPDAYASAMLGNGKVYGGNTSGDRDMQGRALELRFGRELDLSAADGPRFMTPGANLRVDFVHYNEGHPENNHRDGFAAQLVYSNVFSRKISGELGIGPYLSMNTTKIGGEELNDSNLGLLASLALRIGLDQYSPGLHLRIGLNHVAMRSVHSSNALLVGIGKTFDSPPPDAGAGSNTLHNPVWIGASAGRSITNHGSTEGSNGFSLDARQYYGEPWAASIAAIVEGDDKVRVDRRGIAVQGWFVQPLTDKWTVSAGIGPYAARNARGPHGTRLHGLITLQADRSLSKTVKVFASFSRVKTFMEKNDRDLFRVGLTKQFND